MNQQLLDFIKRQMASGRSREDISQVLVSKGGWTEAEVKDAFTSLAAPVSTIAAQSISTPPPPTPPPPTPAPSGVGTSTSSPTNVGAAPWHGVQTPGVYKESRPPKGLRTSTTVSLVALFLILAGGAAWAFFVYFPNLIKPKPEEAVARSLQALITAPTIRINGTLQALGDFESKTAIASSTTSTTTIKTKVSSTTPDVVKGMYDLKLGFVSNVDRRTEGEPKITLSLSPDVSVKIPPFAFDLSAVLDTRSINRTIYIQLRSMTDLLFPIDFARLKGVWIRLEPSDYTQYGSLPNSEQAVLWEKISTSDAFVITQELPLVKEGGERYRHYAFRIDYSKLQTLIAELNRIPGAATTTASLATLPGPTGEIWLSSSDYFPHKLTLTYKLDGAKTDIASSGETQLSGTVTLEALFSRTIEEGGLNAPADATSLSDIMTLLESPKQASSTASGTPAVR